MLTANLRLWRTKDSAIFASLVIDFKKHTLDNGLRVILHRDTSSPLVAVNVLYDVGARDEDPEKTGFAHLFEHLMFEGSINVSDFDDQLQKAGGESNAFTNNDITNYYEILPAVNLETALWLESDRMLDIGITQEKLDIQKNVVIEEFKEGYLNQPYGDVWHTLSAMAFTRHPYRWPTIGLKPEHIASASLDDVKNFYHRFYQPSNAILCLSGGIDLDHSLRLVQKWFDDIPPHPIHRIERPAEPQQTELRRKVIESEVPQDAVYFAFHIPHRLHPDYIPADLLTDVLSNSDSSRLERKLVKEDEILSEAEAYVLGSHDPGLLIVEGKLNEGVSIEFAEDAVWEILQDLASEPISDGEMTRIRNKAATQKEFSEVNIFHRALNLSIYELLGNAEEINNEIDKYLSVQSADLMRVARSIFRKENCSILHYLKR